jgi:hypothetical protein
MTSKSTVKRTRDTFRGREVRRALCAKNVRDAIGTVERGCEIFCLAKGTFSVIDVIEYVLEATGPCHCTVATWTASGSDLTFANRLLTNGSLLSMRFIVDFSFSARQPAYLAAMRERFGDECIRITKAHAKFVLLKNETWNIAIRTSANLNENKRLESFEISDCRALAGYLQDVADQLFAEQTAAEAFGRRPIEHVEAFETQWGDDGGGVEAARNSTDTKRYFDDSPLGNDMRRVGLSFL